ncbi:uncharacterized protein LOC131152155 [Malania oleifera]|uniref:uncharacterized protein LOC131152155 n=1 Tax=Malania oleifera TaxID=397392 RepID=UPI0025AEC6A5|nr:uncharacterized protein LOC131152155 [Malania oleifera]
MKAKSNASIGLRMLFSASRNLFFLSEALVSKNFIFCPIATANRVFCSLYEPNIERVAGEVGDCPKESAAEVLRNWGCSESEISKIFRRSPSLRNARPSNLHSKLAFLRDLGLTTSELVKIVNCRPRFLSYRIHDLSEERLQYLQEFFGSNERLIKAIIRNPSILTYDIHKKVKPVIALYEEVGVGRNDLISMLLSRPTLISRSSFDDEKLEYIHKTGISMDSKMYKHVVSIIAVSRLETIREKVANFEKFGFSDDEVFGLFGRSPFTLTLSVDKVQRNMTFVLGTMKLPAKVVLNHPYLLWLNLEAILRPRVLLAAKIEEMGLVPQIKGPEILTALRMKEKRFLEAFVTCHPNDVSHQLMEWYRNVKCVKRLAEGSKRNICKGFPF